MAISASEVGTENGGLPASTGLGLVACSPFTAKIEPNSSSLVRSDALMVCIGTTLTRETASCHQVNTPSVQELNVLRLNDRLNVLSAKSAHEIDDEADEQNQAEGATAENETSKVKATAAEQ